jgi:hypothetical protein
MTANTRVKCRFCDWSRPRWFKVDGRPKSGMSALLRHVDAEHPEEAEKILKYVGDNENGSLAESEFECTLQ